MDKGIVTLIGASLIVYIYRFFLSKKESQTQKTDKNETSSDAINIPIIGMHCASCAINIERKLRKMPEIESVQVSYAQESALVRIKEHINIQNKIESAIHELGYKAVFPKNKSQSVDDDVEKEREKEKKSQQIKLSLSVLLTIPIILGSFPNIFTFTPDILQHKSTLWLLSTPIQFYIGWQFYKSTLASIRNRMANMDTLIAVGTTAAYAFSSAMALFPETFMTLGVEGHYFDVSAVVITLVLLGKYLEASAKGKTGSAIKKLINIQPKIALIKKGSEIMQVPVEKVLVGDILVVRTGDKIPVDGEIITGTITLDESMISGESLSVEKKSGDTVIGGTIAKSGTIEYKATKVGADTVLAQIVSLVQAAQSSRAPIQNLTDTISGYFIPIVLMIATLTFVGWYLFGPSPAILYALLNAVGVLIIACPCALGLATPTAIIVGTGKGAQNGILIKNAEILEKLQKVTHAVFDKTGTITQGKPTVTDFHNVSDKSDAVILEIIGSVESRSAHPLAESIVAYVKSKIDIVTGVESVETVEGKGVIAKINASTIHIGEKILEENGIELSGAEDIIQKLKSEAKTVVPVAIDKALVAVFAIRDDIRPSANDTMLHLKKRGIKTLMLTGDTDETARVIAQACGIEEYKARVLPQDKENIIRQLQESNAKVVMLGDGINDAPALAAADVGISMATGTDIAIETADVVFLSGDIQKLPFAIDLSRKTMNTIKQNLIWAFGYNVILIPVAAGVLYIFGGPVLNPMFASVAMATSSISVVLNSLRLNLVKYSHNTIEGAWEKL